MWPAFPASDYYGSSAPPRRYQPTTGLPADQLAAGRGGDRRSGSHVHSRTVRRVRCPTMPLQLRHEYAAGLPRGLPTGDINRPRSSPHPSAGARCDPAIRQVPAGGSLLRGVHTLVHRRYTFPSCLPDPVHLTVLVRPGVVRGCLPPSPSSQGSGCPQLQSARCDEPTAVSFHHRTVRERLVALDVAAPTGVELGVGPEDPPDEIDRPRSGVRIGDSRCATAWGNGRPSRRGP